MTLNSNRIFLPGNQYLIAYLAFLGSFAPISTDMYLPALPVMVANMNTNEDLVSLTISGFIVTFAISMLFWGPFSDKYGRKKTLFSASIIFILASVFIAVASSIYTLLFWRFVQAIGSGGLCAMSLAIVKDLFHGQKMEKIISIIQAAHIIAPIVAPILGGWMLMFISWRGIFWCLTICGVISLLGGAALKETNSSSNPDSDSLQDIFYVLKQKSFLYPLIIFSILAMPFMAYLGTSSFIFQDTFGMSAQKFSLFFAFNAAFSLIGPLAHILFFRRFNRNFVITLHMSLIVVAGFLVFIIGENGPVIFALLFAPITFCGSALRPPSTVLIMESINGHNGIVSSLISCFALLCGGLSMMISTLPFWPNNIYSTGVIACVVSLLCLFAWMIYIHRQH